MTKKLIIFVIGIVFTGIAAFALSGQTNFPVISSAQNKSPETPDNVVYQRLFRQVATFKAKADELERQGKDAGHLHRFFKHKADLSDEQTQMLERIAEQCASEIKVIDERVKPIIEAYKAQYPNGQVPHGQLPAAPSAELRKMTEEKNSIVLRKRDELRSAFGENEFKRFHEFVKNKMVSNVAPDSAEQ